MMIRDESELKLISSLGWVERGSLWIFDVGKDEIQILHLSEANYLSLHKGSKNNFSVVHHFEDRHLEITAHAFSRPGRTISRIFVGDNGNTFSGDLSVWKDLPHAYVSFISFDGVKDYWLLIIDSSTKTVSRQRFDWYNDSYDKGYQGIVGVTEVPGSRLLLVSVQRDSHPVLFDPIDGIVLMKLSLAGGYGNPSLAFRSSANELWVDDYDTLMKIDPSSWEVINSRKLQEGQNGSAQFIGQFAFNTGESRCAVDAQPLEVALLSDGRVFARSWKNGKLLAGFKPENLN